MNVLIVEDEELSAERLQKMLSRLDRTIFVVGIIPSVFETIAYLLNDSKPKPDLIFLDIHLEDDNGFRIFENLDLMIPIVFTTAYDEYMLKAFKTNSLDYLLKPINLLELQAALFKFQKLNLSDPTNKAAILSEKVEIPTYKNRFLCSVGSRIFTFKVSEIAYFIIEERATFMRLFDGRHFAVEYSLEKLSKILDPDHFFRINRTIIVSINSILNICYTSAGKLKLDIDPTTQQEIIVSPDRVINFKNWLGR